MMVRMHVSLIWYTYYSTLSDSTQPISYRMHISFLAERWRLLMDRSKDPLQIVEDDRPEV
jgi:hypothetical protein